MTQTPRRISVVVPTYEGASALADTLESIRRQTMQPAEVIVVDDGSVDDSVVVAERHPVGARVVRLGSNHGVAFARNVGLREASSELIAFVDQDDLWMPRRLERLSAAFAEHPEWRAVVTDETVFAVEEDRAVLTGMGHDFLPWVEHWRRRDEVLTLLDDLDQLPSSLPRSEPIPAQRILAGSITVTTSYVLDRKLALDCGGFSGWLRSADDWVLLQTMSQYVEFQRLHGAPVLYRVHPDNTSTTTDWPMPLMVAAAAVRQGGRVVPRGADRDPDVVGPLASSPFLLHVLRAQARAGSWRARADALAAWQLLSTDAADRRSTGRVLVRSLVAGVAPDWFRSSVRRIRGEGPT